MLVFVLFGHLGSKKELKGVKHSADRHPFFVSHAVLSIFTRYPVMHAPAQTTKTFIRYWCVSYVLYLISWIWGTVCLWCCWEIHIFLCGAYIFVFWLSFSPGFTLTLLTLFWIAVLCLNRIKSKPSSPHQSPSLHLCFSQYPQPRPAPLMPSTTIWRRLPMRTSMPTFRRPKRASRPNTVRGCHRYEKGQEHPGIENWSVMGASTKSNTCTR